MAAPHVGRRTYRAWQWRAGPVEVDAALYPQLWSSREQHSRMVRRLRQDCRLRLRAASDLPRLRFVSPWLMPRHHEHKYGCVANQRRCNRNGTNGTLPMLTED